MVFTYGLQAREDSFSRINVIHEVYDANVVLYDVWDMGVAYHCSTNCTTMVHAQFFRGLIWRLIP